MRNMVGYIDTPETQKMFDDNRKLVYATYGYYLRDIKSIPYDDMIQIGFITLWKCCHNYKPYSEVKFSTYFCNSYKKNVYNIVKYNRTKKIRSLDMEYTVMESIIQEEKSPLDPEEENKALLAKLKAALSVENYQIVYMRSLGMSLKQVGQIVGLSKERIRQKLLIIRRVVFDVLEIEDGVCRPSKKIGNGKTKRDANGNS